MSAVWECNELSGSETLVLLALADHADDRGHCWPSIERIAFKARLSERQTQRIVARLELAGVLQVDRPKVGRSHTSRYTVIPKGVKKSPLSAEGCHPGQKRVTPVTRKGDIAVSPESPISINNPQNPEALNTPAEKKEPIQIGKHLANMRKSLRGG